MYLSCITIEAAWLESLCKSLFATFIPMPSEKIYTYAILGAGSVAISLAGYRFR